jgi:hypothetical protein
MKKSLKIINYRVHSHNVKFLINFSAHLTEITKRELVLSQEGGGMHAMAAGAQPDRLLNWNTAFLAEPLTLAQLTHVKKKCFFKIEIGQEACKMC